MQQTNEGSKQGDSQNEALGTIHRVEHPNVLGIAPFGSKFLTHNAMLRKSLGNHLPHHLLGTAVSQRYRRSIALQLHAHVSRSVIGQDHPGTGLGKFPNEGDKGLVIHDDDPLKQECPCLETEDPRRNERQRQGRTKDAKRRSANWLPKRSASRTAALASSQRPTPSRKTATRKCN